MERAMIYMEKWQHRESVLRRDTKRREGVVPGIIGSITVAIRRTWTL
jgi:hypothetical protein